MINCVCFLLSSHGGWKVYIGDDVIQICLVLAMTFIHVTNANGCRVLWCWQRLVVNMISPPLHLRAAGLWLLVHSLVWTQLVSGDSAISLSLLRSKAL